MAKLNKKEKPVDEKEIIHMLEIAAKDDILKKLKRAVWTWTHFGIQQNIQDLIPIERKNEIQKIFKSRSQYAESDVAEVLSRFSIIDI